MRTAVVMATRGRGKDTEEVWFRGVFGGGRRAPEVCKKVSITERSEVILSCGDGEE